LDALPLERSRSRGNTQISAIRIRYIMEYLYP
jgi:hypothetical protein